MVNHIDKRITSIKGALLPYKPKVYQQAHENIDVLFIFLHHDGYAYTPTMSRRSKLFNAAM
jgi:hypothetical protein